MTKHPALASYYGGKHRQASWIVPLLPKTEGYLEPFGGMLNVFFAKPRSKVNILNDIDGRIVSVYRALRDEPEELMRLLCLTPHSREEFELACIDDTSLPNVERARRTLVALEQSIQHSLGEGNLRTYNWRRKFANTNLRTEDQWGEIISVLREKISGVQIENMDAIKLIEKSRGHSHFLIYCDPPYAMETRNRKNCYRYESDDDLQTGLLSALAQARCKVAVSGYASDLYADALQGWECHSKQFHNPTSAGNSEKSINSFRQECLWVNYVLEDSSLL